MSGFLAGADVGVVAKLDQRFKAICDAQANVLARMPKPGDAPEDTFARLLTSIPDAMTGDEAKGWMCAAMTQLAHSKKDNSEERAV